MVRKLLFFIIPIVIVIIYGFKPHDEPGNNNHNGTGPYRIIQHPNQTMAAVDSKKLDANQISTWFRTNGSFNRDPSTGNAGFEWPKGSGKTARYASGLWLGCIAGNNGDTLTAVAEYSYDYLPGWCNETGGQGQEDPAYRIYQIYQGNTTSDDYLNWPADQGAYLDSNGKPLFLGTQTQFYSYTDGYPHTSGSTSTRSLNAQILQTNWSYNVNGPLGNIVFQEYRVINKSNFTWTQTYLAQWTDDDLGASTDDKVGVDTALNLGFTYNSTNNDGIYGSAPPAVGFDFFRGALVYTGNTNDTVSYFSPPGSTHKVVKVGYKDLGLKVFNYYNNGSPEPSDPRNNTETYRVLEGKWRLGNSWVNPITNDTTTKCYTGDPVTGSGWLNPGEADRRFIQCTGPFTMAPGDTQIIVVAQVIARGNSNLASITALRSTDDLAQRIFNNNFQVPESAPVVPASYYAPGNGKIYISWNDTAEKISIRNKLSGGTYRFQGYNLYQIKGGTTGSESSDRVLMATYDKKDGITDIYDSVFNTTYGTYIYYAVQKGSDNGITRYFVMDRDYVNNNPLYNGTPYNVVVTAYYYDSLGGPFSAPKVNETPITSTNIKVVIPQNLTIGTTVNYNIGDTIATNQRDLGTMPIIFQPLSLVTGKYTSTYGGTNSNPTWSLTRTTSGGTSTLFENQTDFTGLLDTAKSVDGFLIVHQPIKDSGVVRDPDEPSRVANGLSTYSRYQGWSYNPPNNLWLSGPDTTAVKTAKVITNRQFDSRTIGISFPTTGTFRNSKSTIAANDSTFRPVSPTSQILRGGPLRKIKIVFGQTSKAYRYAPTDTNYTNTPLANRLNLGAGMVDVPFSVYAVEDLDSSAGAPRQLNVGFLDADSSGTWNPKSSTLGGYEFTYIFASTYSTDTSSQSYTTKNPGLGGTAVGFTSMDVMYAWLPRVKTVSGAPLTWTNGDELTIYPYVITRPNFVPGFPVSYSFDIQGTTIGSHDLASKELSQIKAFPNPYYAQSRLETDPFGRFIYFNHLPSTCTIYIYTLDGVLVSRIQRNNTDPNNSLEKWNLHNQDDIPVASGMYIVYIDAGSLGTKTLKIAIFTPEERLDTF